MILELVAFSDKLQRIYEIFCLKLFVSTTDMIPNNFILSYRFLYTNGVKNDGYITNIKTQT